jgi:hypothetical protein
VAETLPGQSTGGGGLVSDADKVGTDKETGDDGMGSMIIGLAVGVVVCCLLALLVIVTVRRRRARAAASTSRHDVLSTRAAGPQVSERSAAVGPQVSARAPPLTATPLPAAPGKQKRRSRSGSKSSKKQASTPSLSPAGGTYTSVSDVMANNTGGGGARTSIYSAAPARGGPRSTAPPPTDLYGPITGVRSGSTPTTTTPPAGNDTYGSVGLGGVGGAGGTQNLYETTADALGRASQHQSEPAVEYGQLKPDKVDIIYSAL